LGRQGAFLPPLEATRPKLKRKNKKNLALSRDGLIIYLTISGLFFFMWYVEAAEIS
jgi:hypothetical protein